MPPRHEVSEYEAFVSGETAQVVARDDRDGQIVLLERGQAGVVRTDVIAHYSCPIPGCSSPRPLSTRGGSKRDHFFHRVPHPHPGGVESLNHLQAKHMLAAWARGATGEIVDVQVNEEEWSPGARRRPDVMVTWPDGRQVALEVEYKAVKVEAWQAKEDAYRTAGITVVWLFGHAPNRYLRRDTRHNLARTDDDAGWRLVPLTDAVAAAGHPVLFINPDEEKLGTLWTRGTPLVEARQHPGWWRSPGLLPGEFHDPAPDRKQTFELALCALDDCTLDPVAGLQTPMLEDIAAERERVAAAVNEEKVALEQRRQAAQARRLARRAQVHSAHVSRRPPASPTGYTCRRCGRPLDPVQASSGRHIGC